MYDRILLATNGGVASANAEAQAIELADFHNATLHVIFVVDQAVVNAYSGDEYVDEAEGPEHGLEELGEETLAAVRRAATEAGVEVEDVLRIGDPAGTIVEYAQAQDVDLLVLGTKYRSREYRALLGSVTDRVVRLTTRPTKIVKTAVED